MVRVTADVALSFLWWFLDQATVKRAGLASCLYVIILIIPVKVFSTVSSHKNKKHFLDHTELDEGHILKQWARPS